MACVHAELLSALVAAELQLGVIKAQVAAVDAAFELQEQDEKMLPLIGSAQPPRRPPVELPRIAPAVEARLEKVRALQRMRALSIGNAQEFGDDLYAVALLRTHAGMAREDGVQQFLAAAGALQRAAREERAALAR